MERNHEVTKIQNLLDDKGELLDRAANLDYKVIVSDQHQVFDQMSGKAILDDGTQIQIRDVLCFAEKVHNKY